MSIPILGAYSKFKVLYNHLQILPLFTGFLDIFYNESALLVDTELESDSHFDFIPMKLI